MINPNVKDYITDLLTDNRCYFALNNHYERLIKEEWQKLHIKTTNCKTNEDFIECYKMVNNICRWNILIRLNNKDITDNLRKVKDLRNGIIKEI